MKQLSIVVPLFNEQETVAHFAREVTKVSKLLPKDTELILVNDGSSDKTAEEISSVDWPFPTSVISFSRNFGHQSALLAGMSKAKGKAVVTLDSDLQHPPKLIPKLFALYKKGFDVVLTQRIDNPKAVPFLKRFTSTLFYHLINSVSETHIPVSTSDFRLLSRRSLDVLLSMPENRKFLRGMVHWIGFETVIVPFEVEKRVAGESKYSVSKMMQLAFMGVTSFSVMPLYFSGVFSVGLFLLAFAYTVYVFYIKFTSNQAVSGWASMLIVLLILGGFLSLFLGLIGFYLAAIYMEVKNRPAYIINEIRSIKQRST